MLSTSSRNSTATGAFRFARGAALSACSTFVALVSLLLVGKMAAVALPPEDVAFFMLVLLAADAMNLASNFGLFASAPKLIAEQPSPRARGEVLTSMLSGQGVVSLLASLIMMIAAFVSWENRMMLLLAAPLGVMGAFRDTLLAALAGLHRYGAHTIASITLSAGQAIAVYLLVWRGSSSVDALLVAVLLAQTAGTGLLVALTAIHLQAIPTARAYFSAVRFSIPLWVNTLLNFGFQRFDTVLVTSALGLPATAVYEIAKRFPQTLSRVLNALLLPWLPTITTLLSQGRREDAARALGKVLCVITYLGYGAVLVAFALREPLVLLLATPQYLPAAAILAWLMTGIHFAVQAGVFGQTLIAINKPGIVTFANIVQAAVSLSITLMLLPSQELMAPCYAWCIGAGLSLLIQMIAVSLRRLFGYSGTWAWLHLAFAGSVVAGMFLPGIWGNAAAIGIFTIAGGMPLLKIIRPGRAA